MEKCIVFLRNSIKQYFKFLTMNQNLVFVDLFLQIEFHENLFSLNRIVSHKWTIDTSDC
jgi:hypothetical protein